MVDRKKIRQKACRREEAAAINRLIDSSLDRGGKNGVTKRMKLLRDETPDGDVECSRVVRARANSVKERGRTMEEDRRRETTRWRKGESRVGKEKKKREKERNRSSLLKPPLRKSGLAGPRRLP